MSQAIIAEARPASATGQERVRAKASQDALHRHARASLLVLVALAVLFQLPSMALADVAAYHLWNGNDAHTLWQAYLSRPVPEVLFVGESSTRTDVDVDAVAGLLSQTAGRRVTVGKFGLNGESADFYVAELYRILHLPKRPRLVVLQVDVLQFTATDVLDPTRDMWLMREPYDAGYLQTAYRVAPDKQRLVLDFAVPFFATWPLISIGARCPMTTAVRTATAKLHLPASNLATAPSPCEEGAHPRADTRMTADDVRAVELNYTTFLANYEFSAEKATYLKEAVAMVRAAGGLPALMEYPNYYLESVNPQAYSTFRDGSARIAATTGTSLVHLDGTSVLDPGLWADPAHMNQWGAQAFAPVLAAAVAGKVDA